MLPHRWRRAIDLAQAAWLEHARFDPVLRWTPERLATHQERGWRAVARAATGAAPDGSGGS